MQRPRARTRGPRNCSRASRQRRRAEDGKTPASAAGVLLGGPGITGLGDGHGNEGVYRRLVVGPGWTALTVVGAMALPRRLRRFP